MCSQFYEMFVKPERITGLDQYFSGEIQILNGQIRADHVLFQVLILVKTCQDLLKTCQV